MNRKILKIIHICIINPLLILFYLSNLPNTFVKQFIYVVRWIIISTMVEWTILSRGENCLLSWLDYRMVNGHLYKNVHYFVYCLNKKPILTLFLSIIDTILPPTQI